MTNRHPRPRLAALVAALSITLLGAGVSDPFRMALAANLIS